MWKKLLLITVVSLAAIACQPADWSNGKLPLVLRVAVTTSTRDSGLLDELVPLFENQAGARVDIIAVGTGAALKLGESGDVDVVLVHARAAEDAFMAAGHGVRREDVMYNRFVILGPAEDPADVKHLGPREALQEIADSKCKFVSRGDDSGTHKRELQLWGDGRIEGDALVETGQGMGRTLTIANEMRAYVLSDYGTYLRFRDKMELVPLVDESPDLLNPYGAMVVDPNRRPAGTGQLAEQFLDFLIDVDTQSRIRDFRVDGEPLFVPLRLR